MTPEATPDQQREVLEALYHSLKEPFGSGGTSYILNEHRRFLLMLDCGAFVDAALMLVDTGPQGWSVWVGWEGGVGNAFLIPNEDNQRGRIDCDGSTPALALCAAIESIAR